MISNELLKKKILDEAIHGRLIENDPSLPPVDVQESIDNIPFDVPSNWKWIRFGDLVKDCYQGINTAGDKVEFVEEDGVPIIQVGDMTSGIININNTKLMSYEDYDYYKDKYQPKYNDIFYCNIGTIGCPLIYRENYEMLFHWNIFIIKYNEKYSDVVFLKWCLEYYTDIFKKMTSGSAMKFVSKKKLLNTLFPVPPLEEQEKIVKKIEELFQLIDKKEKNDKEKEKLKILLKEKILDSAIHGELVENDLSLPTVDVEEIKEDIPFEIPNNWKWCCYKKIGVSGIGLTYKPDNINDKGMIVLRSSNIQDGKLDLKDIIRVSCEVKDNIIVNENDILICARNGSKRLIGKSCLLENLSEKMTYGAFMTIFRTPYYKYVYWFMQSKHYYNQLHENTNTMTINQITQNKLGSLLIPIPPLEQQKKIVEKIEKCFELIEQL